MGRITFFCAGTTEAVSSAVLQLRRQGIHFDHMPGAGVTDLLLDVPSFNSQGNLRDGEDAEALFSRLPPGIRVWGGNLKPVRSFIPMDLLQNTTYLAENAAITADCALKIAAPLLPTTWKLSHVLVIGWGRIGKQLCKTLKGLGAAVTVCARKASDRALLRAFGYNTAELPQLPGLLSQFDLVFNTAPAKILGSAVMDSHPHCIAIDLASVPGLEGKNVIYARGLPGKLAPAASGKLIADTVLRLGKEVFAE